MATNMTAMPTKAQPAELFIVAYYSLTIIIVGTSLNSLTFLIHCRRTFRNMDVRPIVHYMRAMAIFDILMLYGWNLDHYLSTIHNFYILRYSIVTCRYISFISYFAPQSSAWLRVFVCLDRYFSLSHLHRTWLHKSKHVLIIIGCIMLTFTLLNSHFFVFVCFHRPNGSISALSWAYSIYPLWDYVHLVVYNCVPLILMTVLNSGVIYHLIRLRRATTVLNSRIQHRAIAITSVVTTFLFLVMAVPATIAFAFFSSADANLLRIFDSLLYSYHMTSFPIYFITFNEFRRECLALVTWRANGRRIVPQTVTAPRTVNK